MRRTQKEDYREHPFRYTRLFLLRWPMHKGGLGWAVSLADVLNVFNRLVARWTLEGRDHGVQVDQPANCLEMGWYRIIDCAAAPRENIVTASCPLSAQD